jgi:hypothetical protein
LVHDLQTFFFFKICHIKFHDKIHKPFSSILDQKQFMELHKKKLVYDSQDFLNFFIVNQIYVIEIHDKSLGLRGLLFIYLFVMD